MFSKVPDSRHPAWEQACEAVAVDGHISKLKVSAKSAKLKADGAYGVALRSRSSEESVASSATGSSASSASSHLNMILPALGLGSLPEDESKGQFSGAQGQDVGGGWKWQGQPGPSPSEALSKASTLLTQDSAKTQEEDSFDERCVQDLTEGWHGSARASSEGKFGDAKKHGTFRGAFRFHEPALLGKLTFVSL
mmetsp:Transcript_52442/g.170280  ORF Transcript_52442/g.170280 Transcript_52442/m.170280 type:complete len:194 (+) Transcript_52442:71-652(+)